MYAIRSYYGTRFYMLDTNVSSLESHQRIAFYPKRGDNQLSRLPVSNPIAIVIHDLCDDEIRLVMSSTARLTP